MDVTTHSTPTDIVMSLIVGPEQGSSRTASPSSGSSYKRDPSLGRIKSHPSSPKFSPRSTTDERKKTIGYLEHGKEIELERFSDGASISISKKGKEKEKERAPHLSPPSLVSNENSNIEKEEFFTIFFGSEHPPSISEYFTRFLPHYGAWLLSFSRTFLHNTPPFYDHRRDSL